MCGIFGFMGSNQKRLEEMAATMRMRGPDDVSYYVDEYVSLGMVRLAIVDRSDGKQPFVSEDGNVVVFYNGEIYNWRELRAMLVTRNHKMSTQCDGEVIPHLYEEYGSKCFDMLDGMFAIAIWDKSKRQLLLMRDHAGVKPLFYNPSRRSFGSTTAAVRMGGTLRKISDYWTWGYPMEEAVWDGVRIFPPNSCVKDFVVPALQHKRRFGSTTVGVEKKTLTTLFIDAVEKRMVADRPIGLFLSGGLDSACVLAVMSDIAKEPINTYTLCFDPEPEGKSQDRRLAKMLSVEYGTNHHEVTVTPEDVWSALPEIAKVFDQPFAGCISTYFLAKAAKEDVDCVMTGDGADELFGSYLSHRLAAQIRTVPASTWRAGLCMDATSVTREIDEMGGRDELDNLLRWEWTRLFPACVLAFADALSMAWALEVRSPFIDKKLVNAAFTIESDRKIEIEQMRTKAVLRSIAYDLDVLCEVIERKKEGFVQPSLKWMRTHWKDRICFELLSDKYADLKKMFYLYNNDNYGYKLWTAVCYEIWKKEVVNVA
jgi:asparagine synthase (glutamine-hydrolysing)